AADAVIALGPEVLAAWAWMFAVLAAEAYWLAGFAEMQALKGESERVTKLLADGFITGVQGKAQQYQEGPWYDAWKQGLEKWKELIRDYRARYKGMPDFEARFAKALSDYIDKNRAAVENGYRARVRPALWKAFGKEHEDGTMLDHFKDRELGWFEIYGRRPENEEEIELFHQFDN